MNSTKRHTALILALAALSLTGLVASANANAASSITGVVYANGYRQPSTTATLFRWTNSGWVRTSLKTTTSSTGRYTFTGLADNVSYSVEGYQAYGRCFIGTGVDAWRGYSRVVDARGGAYGANITMAFEQHITC